MGKRNRRTVSPWKDRQGKGSQRKKPAKPTESKPFDIDYIKNLIAFGAYVHPSAIPKGIGNEFIELNKANLRRLKKEKKK